MQTKLLKIETFRVVFREIGTRFDDKYRVHRRAGGKGKQGYRLADHRIGFPSTCHEQHPH